MEIVKNGRFIVNESNYSIEADSITIDKNYLSKLANGTKTFTFVDENGNETTREIIVQD